jgi:hypothetical protein
MSVSPGNDLPSSPEDKEKPEESMSQSDASLFLQTNPVSQALEDIPLQDQRSMDQIIEDAAHLSHAEELSEEELTRQALNDPGADGDTQTPE